MTEEAAPAVDLHALIRSRQYRVMLVFAAVIGVFVSFVAWGFLEAVHGIQVWVYQDLPDDLGFDTVPRWWPLPWLALAGLLTALAITRLPGHGGHVPVEGLKAGSITQPSDVPGVLLAALATLGLGLVLGPEAPLIALGMGLALFVVRRARPGTPPQAQNVLAAAGSFAAISTVFGSPVIGSIVMVEAVGLAGANLTVMLLPGLISAGIGSLVFIGMGEWSGLSMSAWALNPLALPTFARPGWGDFGWTIVLAVATAVGVFVIIEIGHRSKRIVERRPVLLTIAAALVVGGLAIVFSEITDKPVDAVLFSGQDAFGTFMHEGPTLSLSTLALLLICKGVAWGISLGNFRGGPTFPALFLGAAAGLLASHLPGYAETQAVAALMGAACVSMLRLPLSSIVIALLLTSQAGLAVAPLIIVAVVVAYITTMMLSAWRATDEKEEAAPASPAAVSHHPSS